MSVLPIVSCRACSGASLSSGAMSRSRFMSADETNKHTDQAAATWQTVAYGDAVLS